MLNLRLTPTANAREIRLHLPAAEIYSISVSGKQHIIYDPFKPLTTEQKLNPDPYTPPFALGYSFLWFCRPSYRCAASLSERRVSLVGGGTICRTARIQRDARNGETGSVYACIHFRRHYYYPSGVLLLVSFWHKAFHLRQTVELPTNAPGLTCANLDSLRVVPFEGSCSVYVLASC